MSTFYKHPLYILLANIALCCLASCKQASAPLFKRISSSQTNIHFANNLADHDSLNILDYLYYYNGGGVAIGDINNDGFPDLFFSANSKGHNQLYLNKGHLQFEDITQKAGVQGISDWCTGVTMADINADGWLDIYVCSVNGKLGLKGKNQLLINNHNGTFTDSAAAYGLDFSGYSTQAAFFDFDHDGDLDCYLLNQSDHQTDRFGDTSMRHQPSILAGDKFFRNELNNGKYKFTDITATSGIYTGASGYGLGIAVADMNNDGWEDIYIGNDFHENDYYYINNGNGSFTESGAKFFNHYSRFSMGNDIADYNNDGQPDVITVDMLPKDEQVLKTYAGGEQMDIYNYNILQNGFQHQFSRNCLQQNLGSGKAFADVALQSGISATDWSWSPLLADYDNDGIKDLFISNGIVKRPVDLDYTKFIFDAANARALSASHRLDSIALNKMPDGKMHSYLYKGDGYGGFTDKSMEWGFSKPGYANGAAYADLDDDGDLDLVTNNINEEAAVYENTRSPDHKSLSIQFKGTGFNTKGIGCKVYLMNKGSLQYQQLMLTRGFQSSGEAMLHFGIDTLTSIDSVMVIWPSSAYQIFTHVPAGKKIIADEAQASGRFDYQAFFPSTQPLFTDITSSINLPWKHKENTFSDFNQQYFIPHELSTAGPKLAVADINGDGLDDFYACGAKGQPGTLWMQTIDGKFTNTDTALFAKDALCEDVDALFFDADKDGDKDLYVTSGGNEAWGNSPALPDRLYINDGKGHFTKSADALPPVYQNKACVTAADIDHDGDLDLFVGVRIISPAYGIPASSYLLINDGHGKFTVDTTQSLPFKDIGMVTAASFVDADKDGWMDLAIAGEWMPLKIFLNKRGSFKEQNQPQPFGLWQSLAVADINGDGNMDILAGNYGLNSKLHASADAPLHLYVKDLDNNTMIDQLLTYTVNGKEYTFLGKDELEKQIPIIKKKFLLYNSFAGKTVREVFGAQLDGALTLKAEELSSGYFLNDGKGNFNFHSFTAEMQRSPLFAFAVTDINKDGRQDIIAGGNFSGVLPYEGRYDADWGDVLINRENGNLQWQLPTKSGWLVRGEVRDIKQIKTATGVIYAAARNNEGIQFFKPAYR